MFGEFCFCQRRAYAEKFHRAVAGAEIVEVVEICAEDDLLQTVFGRDIQKLLTQMALAVKAPVRFVGDEIGVFKLVCIDGLQSDAEIFCDFFCPFQNVSSAQRRLR